MKKTFTLLTMLAVGVAQAQVPTDGLYAFYPFSGNANDAVGGLHGTVSNATLTTDRAGSPNSAYEFNGTNAHINLNNFGAWRINENDGISVSAWVRTQADFGASLGTVFARWTGVVNSDDYAFFLSQTTGRPLMAINSPSNAGVSAPTDINNGLWNHVVFTFSKLTGRHTIYVNGGLVYDQVIAGSVASPNANIYVYIGAQGSMPSGQTRFFKGAIDDVRVYIKELSLNEVQDMYQAEANLAPCPGVGITQQPQGGGICQGSFGLQLTVAVDDPTAAIQWQYDSGSGFNDMTGENGLTVVADFPGQYRAKVTADCGTVTYSDPATVTNGGPSFVTPLPTTAYLCPNVGSLTLTADAVGEGLSFQWRTGVEGQVDTYQEDVPGANSASFTLTQANLNYSVVISACGQSVTSDLVTVLPGLMPNVTIFGTNPSSICAGQQLYLFTQVAQTSTFYWEPTAETSGQIYASPTESTVYTVYATNNQGCTATASIGINILEVEEPVVTQSGADLSVQSIYATYSWWVDYPEVGLSELGVYTPTYTPVENGIYSVSVTINAGSNAGTCTFMSAPFNYSGTVTGISDAASRTFTVFPNPFSNDLTVEVTQPTVLTLHNVLGKEVMSRMVSGRTVISTEALPAGVYLLRDAATANVIRVVKQ